jgi:hypothetical protein
VTGPGLREVYDPALLFWDELCPPCEAAFCRWRDAPNPGAWTNPEVQANPQLLAFLASCRVTGPSPQAWRETVSWQLLLIRRICTERHNIENLSYAGGPPHACQCMTSFAYITPVHPGHCCFVPASQVCHQAEVAEWEHERDRRLGRYGRPDDPLGDS